MSSTDEVIYLDHAATSWPKPDSVREAMLRFLDDVSGNAGRSGHRASFSSAKVVFDAREKAAGLLGVSDSRDLVFTRGATEGLNLVLKGYLEEGDLVYVSPVEHNSLMRPLERLAAERAVRVVEMPADRFGRIDIDAARSLAAAEAPRMVAVSHASNVTGAVQDLGALRGAFPDSSLLVDAAQTVGVLPVAIESAGVDFLACSAHKGLLGPTGVGLCYISPHRDVRPLTEGGTGSRSEETAQPDFRPDRYESGTLNLHGIAGLGGALDHIAAEGLLGEHKTKLCGELIEGLSAVAGVRLQSPADGTALIVSVTVEGKTPDRVALSLEEESGILVRPGLHCSPSAHRHLGTFPDGTVRLGPGYASTESDVAAAVGAVKRIAGGE